MEKEQALTLITSTSGVSKICVFFIFVLMGEIGEIFGLQANLIYLNMSSQGKDHYRKYEHETGEMP